MKIYGDQSFLLDRLSVRSQHRANALQGSSKIAEFADRFIEEQQALSKDQMTVSKEGLDYIRQQLFKLETEDGKNQTLGTKPIDKLCSTYIILYSDVVSEDGVSRNLHMDLMKQYRREMAGKENSDWASHMDSLSKAYAAVRREITEGYENGTRDLWVRDYSTGEDFEGVEFEMDGETVRYRKLTKEEEISYLDKTIDKLIEEEAVKYVKEEEAKAAAEAGKEANKEDEDLEAFRIIIDGLVNEARNLLDKVREEIEKIEKMFEKEIDIGERLETELLAHRAETVARGKQQEQYNHYRKISEMASDARTLLGYIKA